MERGIRDSRAGWISEPPPFFFSREKEQEKEKKGCLKISTGFRAKLVVRARASRNRLLLSGSVIPSIAIGCQALIPAGVANAGFSQIF